MVVDLSRLVSKWIGETEKNLDAVFGEAEASSCVLFFDEADSLFGQRGEVTRGADRYANLEVGYLLQRLERYEGLVILASNLRANLDPAFTRRFHHVVHFPRPAEAGAAAAVGAGARAAGRARRAARARRCSPRSTSPARASRRSCAARRSPSTPTGADALTPRDVLPRPSKQFQREARLLPRELLGPYAALLA